MLRSQLLTVPADRRVTRLVRCIAGLALFGAGINMFKASNLGLPPWDVFHEGLSELIGLSMGIVIQGVGALILLLWIPLRQRPGPGTLLNAFEIGFVFNLVGDRLPTSNSLALRVAWLVAGMVGIAIGSGLYIGAGLGPGPRDGLMVGLAQRGISVRAARTIIEATVMVTGVLLGGTLGFGTALFTLGIGPLVQFFLPPLRVGTTDGDHSNLVDSRIRQA